LNRYLLWITTATLGAVATLVTGIGGLFAGIVFLLLALPLVVRGNTAVALSGLLMGFGALWLLLMGGQSSSGNTLDNAQFCTEGRRRPARQRVRLPGDRCGGARVANLAAAETAGPGQVTPRGSAGRLAPMLRPQEALEGRDHRRRAIIENGKHVAVREAAGCEDWP